MMKSRVLRSDLLRVFATLAMVFVVVVQVDAAVPNYNPLRDPSFGPIPGEDPSYSDYLGVAPPFPGNLSSPILNTTSGTPGLDDVVFQNLLSAEWLVYNVYQQGVELFKASDFINAGFPNTTFDRIAQIRDNEAGHLRVFQDQISNASVVPGPCKYDYGLTGDPAQYLAFATFVELTSMAFVSGLTEQLAKADNYYAVFFHALNTYSVPFNTSTGVVTIPAQIEPLGLLMIAIADEPGAPTAESVLAGPLPILQAPTSLRPYLLGL
ncbi:unnamed protein product [Sphagnum troendelagicum]|uniref:Rds1 protein n=1 Tax=Sphagnum troendelagicum TaxID=128251 RepID=A0ABP0U810_9BRYO